MARRPSRAQVIAALEVILEALKEGPESPAIPLVGPTSREAGRHCPDHLRELVYRADRRAWVCPVPGCRQRVERER